MAETIDSLQIEINAKATKANDAIDRLVGKLDRLTTSLSRVNGTNLNGLANGVQRLGNAMQVMNTIKTADFTRLATNLTKLGTVNVSALNSAASSMSHLTRAFNSLGTVSANAQAVGEMAKNIAKLGNKSVQTAITNIPQLATAMNNLMVTLSKAPRVSQNVIQMTNALANLTSQGSKVGSASNSMVRGLNRTSSSANTARRSFGGLTSAIGKFYAKYFLVIRGLKALWKSIKSTADYIEAYNYFNVALGKIGSDWSYQWEKYGYESAESYADSFNKRLSENLGKLSGLNISIGADGKGLLTESGMKNLGLNIQEITQYASQLASVTNSVGQTGEVSLAVASSFTKLAGDISSLFNVDYSSVSKNLQSGLIGQSRALYKYGIDITNATLQTYAYNLGLSKSVSKMTQAEKMQLRMLAILDQSKASWGDLANTINSPLNMIRQFKNNLKEAGMVLGQLFIPVLQKVLPVINGVTIAIKRLLVNMANLLGIKIDFDAFGQGYSNMEDDIDGITDSYEEAAKTAEEYKNQLLGFDEVNKLSEPSDSGSDVGTGGIDLTQQIIDAASEYEKAWNQAFDRMENKAQKWADRVERIFEPIANPVKKLISDISIGDWFAAGQDVNQFVTAVFNTIEKIIDKVNWEKLGENIGDFLAGLDWVDILFKALKLKFKIWEAIAKVIKESFKKAPLETAIIACFALLNYTRIGKFIGGQIAKKITIDTARTVITAGGLKSAWETLVIKAMYAFEALSASTVIPVGIVASIYIASTIFAAKGIKKHLGNDSKLHKWFETEVLGIDEKGYVTTVTADCTRAEEGVSKLKSQIDGLKDTVINIDVNDKSSIDKANETLVDTINQKNIANKQFQQVSKDYKNIQSTLEKYITKLYKGSVEEFYAFYGQTNDLSDMSQLYEVLTTIGSNNSKVLNQMYDELGTHNVSDIKKVQNSYKSLKEEIDDCNKTIAQLSPTIDESISAYEELNNTTYEYTTSATQHYHDMVVGSKAAISELTMAAGNGANAFSNRYREAFDKTKLDGTNTFTTVAEIVKELSQSAGINGGNQLYTMFDDRVANIPEATRRAFAGIIGQINAGNIGYDEGESLAENIMSGFNASAWRFTDSVQATLREAFSIDADIEAILNADNLSPEEIHKSGAINFAKVKIVPKYATGGFPEDGLFYKNSDEIITQVGGKTQVLNREDTHDMIRQAAYEGMLMAMSQSSNNTNVNVVLQGDADGLFKVVQNKANNYTTQTGRPAFMV